MRKFYSICAVMLAILAMSFSGVGFAQAQSIDQILAAPKVDDIYAGRVDYVSEVEFGEGGEAYGLMRVVEVSPREIVVITAGNAFEDVAEVLEELGGDFSDTAWDPSEEIVIKRSELVALKKEGVFVEARRLTAEQIKNYLN